NRVRGAMKAAGAAKNAEVLAVAGVTAAAPGRSQGDLFAGTPDDVTPDEFPFGANAEPAAAAPDAWKTDYKLIDSAKTWKDFLKQLKAQTRFAIDLETTGLDP